VAKFTESCLDYAVNLLVPTLLVVFGVAAAFPLMCGAAWRGRQLTNLKKPIVVIFPIKGLGYDRARVSKHQASRRMYELRKSPNPMVRSKSATVDGVPGTRRLMPGCRRRS